MPKFVLPVPPKEAANDPEGVSSSADIDDMEFRRRFHSIPVNSKILDSVEMAGEYEILLRANIAGIDSHQRDSGGVNNSLDIDLISVEVYPVDVNEFAELSKDDEPSGWSTR